MQGDQWNHDEHLSVMTSGKLTNDIPVEACWATQLSPHMTVQLGK
jgi:hypothetical protein